MRERPLDFGAPRRRRRPARRCRAALACGIASLTLVLAATAPSSASVPDSGLAGLGAPVADADLGEMRGKFVSPAGIAYFGVELYSSWQNAAGVTVAGVLQFTLDLRDVSGNPQSATPILMVGWSRDCTGCDNQGLPSLAPGSAVIVSAGGLGSVHGAVQSQEIRGSDNVVRNDLRINVTSADDVLASNTSGLTPITSSMTQALPDGAAVHFVVTGTQLGLGLENGPGAGLVGQSVDAGFNQVAQNVLLTSDYNTVHNSVGLTIGVDQMRQAEQINIQNALSAMHGHGF